MIPYQLVLITTFMLLCHIPAKNSVDKIDRANKNDCRIEFTIDNAGIEVVGVIDSADVQIIRKGNTITFIAGTAYPKTIHTGIAIRDKHLQRSDYFDVAKFPVIQITSNRIDNLGRNKFVGVFDLTLKGITKRISVPFHCTQNATALEYKGTFEINRLDFSLGEESMILNNKVAISVMIRVHS